MTDLDTIASTLDSAIRTLSMAGRTVLPVDTNPVPSEWDHITKVDPEHEKKLPLLYPLYLQHTGAIEVGGSRDVTGQNTEEALELVGGRPRPAIQEPSGVEQVTEQTREMADYLAVPQVLNGDTEAIVGTLGSGIEYFREELAPAKIEAKLPIDLGDPLQQRVAAFFSSFALDRAFFEAYIIMNPDSAAARESNVTEDSLLSPSEAKQRAMVAETHLESEIVYLEYSGTFDGEEAVGLLEAIEEGLYWSRLWYGGGLDSRENVEAVLDAGADAAVVGNIFHEVADEEATVTAQAREDLTMEATQSDIKTWVEDNWEASESKAAQYLSTIPTLPDPSARARDYMILTIQAALAVETLAEDLSDLEDADRLESALADQSDFPGFEKISTVVPEDETLPRDLIFGLLAERLDIEADTLPVSHLALE